MAISHAHAQGISLPKCINDERLDRLLPYLDGSDAQIIAIHELHREYIEVWHNSFANDIAELNLLSQNLYVNPSKFMGESMAGAFRTLQNKADVIRFDLDEANDAFLDSIEALLFDGQIDGMNRLKMAVERMRLQRGTYGIPERHIDIIALLEECTLPPADRGLVSAYVSQCGLSYISVLDDVAQADARREVLNFELCDLGRRFAPGSTIPADTEEQMKAIREKAGKLNIRSWKRLVRENRQWLDAVTSMVSAESAAEIRRQYAERAYPQVYPDPAMATALYEQAIASPAIDDDLRVLLAAYRQEYLDRHHVLSESLCRSLYDREVLIFTGHQTNQADAAVEMERARRIGKEREELNMAQLRRIRSILAPEQAAALPAWEYESAKPPRPWDPDYRPEKKRKPQAPAEGATMLPE